MRHKYNGVTKDQNGAVIQSATVSVFLAGTSTAASIYTTAIGTTAVNSVTSDSTDGTFSFYVDRFDYDIGQSFDLTITKSYSSVSYSSQTISNVSIVNTHLGTYTISDDKTVTTNLGYIPEGVIYSVASGKTLTITGQFTAGDYQIFSGAGTITLAAGASPQYSCMWTGATGDGTTDDSTNFQKFLDLVPAGGKIHIPEKTFKVQGLYATQNELVWDCKGWLEPKTNASVAVLTIGLNSSSQTTNTRRWRGNIKVGDIDGAFASWDSVTGIKVEYLNDAELHLDIVGMGTGLALSPDFTTGAVGGPSNAYVAYNKIFLGVMYNNKVAVEIDPKDASSSANENTFYGGRFSLDTGTYVAGCISIKITKGNGAIPNNNVFYRPSFEGAAQVVNIAGRYNHIIDARAELTDSTDHTPAYVAGTDYAEPYVYFASTALGNTFDTSHSDSWSVSFLKDLGAGTRVDDKNFTITGDQTSWLYPGAPIMVTVGGTDYYVYVLSAAYTSSTSVIVSASVITDNPTAVTVPSIQQASGALLNTINLHGYNVTGAQVIQSTESRKRKYYSRSAITISTLSSNYPALWLLPGSSASDAALRISDFDNDNFVVDHSGQLNMLRYNTQTLANDATPSVKGYTLFLTGGTTTITDFDDGVTGQVIIIIAAHSVTITDGTNIFLSGSTNFVMAATDTLTLICKSDNKWYETGRSDNT